MSTVWAATASDVPAAGSRLSLLGRFNLQHDGRVIRLRTRKEEGLLAYLVLHPGSHPREVLAELYWGDTPEEQAKGSLRAALADLRAVLGPEALFSDRVAVQFSPPPGFRVDVLEFRAQATRSLGDAAADPALFDPSLYGGELLAGHYDDWVLAERERLRQLYLDALLHRVGRLRDLVRYSEAIAAAQQVLAADLAEERAHQHLMVLYAITGNRSAALRQLEVCRRSLKEALDVEPSAETLALLDSISWPAQEGAAAAPAPSRVAIASPAVAAPTAEAELTNLPTPLTSFVGRAQELAALCALLQDSGSSPGGRRLVTLTGAGGSGKTRLAIQVARLLAPKNRHGAWWVDLSSLRDPALLPDSALRALGMTPAPGQPAMQALISFLRERSLLLLLDNCEHLLEACAHLVAAILQACPAVCVLATSREPLGVPGEQLWPVPTFAVPAPDEDLDAECLLGYDAVRLFIDRARMHRPAFELTGDNAAQVAEICRRLDGIPLAIELAAARVRTMDLRDILTRLENRLRLLASSSALAPPRQQTLRASIDWSYNLLSPAECLLLQHLAVFVGGCTLAAAEAVCTDCGLAEEEVLDLLVRLVDRSLVVAEGGRYSLLETIREYALERLIDTGAAEALRERHAAYFAGILAEQFDAIRSLEQHQAIVGIAAEIDNVRAAWAWAAAARRCDLLSRSVNGLTWYYEVHAGFHEGEVVFGRALEALGDGPDADPYLLARLHVFHGNFLDRQGKLREARPELERGCAALRHAAAPFDLATALTFLGRNAWEQGDYARAHDLLEESLAISQGASVEMTTALSLFFLALVEHAMDNEPQADRRFREALAASRLLGDPRIISVTLVHWAPTLLALGRVAEARERLQEALPIARETQDRWLIGVALLHLGTVVLAQGDPAGARTALLEAVALTREAGGSWYRAWSEASLGDVYLAEGNVGQAELQYRSALKLAVEADAISLALGALAGFAELRALAGDREGALELARQVSLHPASAGIARARAADILRRLDPDSENQPAVPAADTFEEVVHGILAAGASTGQTVSLS